MDFYNLIVCAISFLVFVRLEAQSQVKGTCILANGKTGQCVRYENCSTAVDMIRRRVGTPEQCGFEGKHPVVCCEIKADLRQRTAGEISKQKCRKIYSALSARTIQVPFSIPVPTVSAVTEASADLSKSEFSIADHINVAEMAKNGTKLTEYPSIDNVYSIIGGVQATPAEFTHMAALGYGQLSSVTWGCGGTLISEKFVLTAAHCINTALGAVKYVRLGDLDLNITTEISRPQDFTVARAIVHPQYKRPSVYHDIALIELSANAIIDEFVRPGCLNTETNIAENVWSATGWGVTSFLGTPANHLQEVQLRPFTQEECQTAYASTTKRKLSNGIDFNSQVCAGEAYKDTCQGDSGGPLQIKNSEFGRGYKVIGVTSFGKACGIGKGPSVYTRVSFYIDWIESIVWPQLQ